MQETIFSNRRFIKAVTLLVVLLSLLVLSVFIRQFTNGEHQSYNGQQQIPSITVSGTGDVMAASDIATLSITISKDAATTADAQKNLNDAVTGALAYLKSQNIADADIKSEYGGVSPKYSYETIACPMESGGLGYPCPPPVGNQKVTGYTATQSITVKIRAIDTANTVRTGLANLGIADISGPDFSIDNQDAVQDQARAVAIDDARTKAEVLAKELHVHLGQVLSFSENGNGPYPMMYAAKGMAASDATAPSTPPVLPTGQNKITSNVTVVYEIY
jgi:uncharacterized protein